MQVIRLTSHYIGYGMFEEALHALSDWGNGKLEIHSAAELSPTVRALYLAKSRGVAEHVFGGICLRVGAETVQAMKRVRENIYEEFESRFGRADGKRRRLCKAEHELAMESGRFCVDNLDGILATAEFSRTGWCYSCCQECKLFPTRALPTFCCQSQSWAEWPARFWITD